MIVGILFSLIIFILGYALRQGKCSWLINTYYMSSDEKKNKYDKLALFRFMSNLIIFFSFMFFIFVIVTSDNYLEFSHKNIVLEILMGVTVIIEITGVIYANTSNRFIKKG